MTDTACMNPAACTFQHCGECGHHVTSVQQTREGDSYRFDVEPCGHSWLEGARFRDGLVERARGQYGPTADYGE